MTSPSSIDLTIRMPERGRDDRGLHPQGLGFLERSGVNGEMLIADKGSTDGSQAIAEALGARVVDVPKKGCGAPPLGGMTVARGRYVGMGDANGSYDISALGPFLAKLREGCRFVLGNRFRGGIGPGAMPPLNRCLSSPVLSGAAVASTIPFLALGRLAGVFAGLPVTELAAAAILAGVTARRSAAAAVSVHAEET